MNKQSNRKLDLRDICGEGNLASALGIGTNVVGGLWKRLKRLNEESRLSSLDLIAAEVAGRLSYIGVTNGDEQIARIYGFSPKLVKPLADYYGTRKERESILQPKLCRAYRYFVL